MSQVTPVQQRIEGLAPTFVPRHLVIHDFAGHPFQVELSREFARRGHQVLHLHCPAYASGKGALARSVDDPSLFDSEQVSLPRFDKGSLLRRPFQEWRYGRMLSRRIAAARPDVVVSANTPLIAQALALFASRRVGASFVFWQQDVISSAAAQVADSKLPFGAIPGRLFAALERTLLSASDAVVTISTDFRDILRRWGIESDRVTVIENWAPLAELPQVQSDNAWARENGLAGRDVLLYSGTLGIKHNPGLLVALAHRFRDETDVRIVVISEGAGADALHVAKRVNGLDNLVLLPFQPYHRLAEVLGSASILVAILERDAGAFSVPSKVLSYLCAGRPILGALPAENLAARILTLAAAGVVTEPDDVEAFVAAAVDLLSHPARRSDMGRSGRAYAERTFDITAIADRFEEAFIIALRRHEASAVPIQRPTQSLIGRER